MYSDFEERTITAISEFISKIVVHERNVKRANYAAWHIEVYFSDIRKIPKIKYRPIRKEVS
ncbi:MAG: DUF4368 domain-containing protein [Peptostreptococcaceae bacterium]|nr:DUF4368 domain-containing protein [Peptostreptococcaceae bacterium]